MRNIDKKYHYLYKTTNLMNGKYYIGMHSTNNLNDGYLGSGIYLRRSIRKYGKYNFKREIIELFDNREKLIQGEINLITREILEDNKCMNLAFGGYASKLGMVSVKDKDGNTFSVFFDDPRYLSGELVSCNKGYICVKDKDGNTLHVSINDPRYLSGELVHISLGVNKNSATVKDKDGKSFRVFCDDPRYLSGELVGCTKGYIHSDETKKKMCESSKGKNIGIKNGNFGKVWIYNYDKSMMIKKEELQLFINNGWKKGRK